MVASKKASFEREKLYKYQNQEIVSTFVNVRLSECLVQIMLKVGKVQKSGRKEDLTVFFNSEHMIYQIYKQYQASYKSELVRN